MKQEPSLKPRNALPFIAFMKDAASRDVARMVAASNGWSEGCVHYGDVRQAIVYLREQPAPKALLVEIPTAAEARELLDRLADVCTPDMQVIVAGPVDEFSFYSWLRSIGIDHYLLQPFSAAQLQETLCAADSKHGAADEQEASSTLIAFMGTRGGVGTTTIATNLAWLLAREYRQETALLDMDPYFGTVGMAFNMQPGHGLRDALDKPDRIDDLFLDRVMARHTEHLAVLSAEEALQESLTSSASAAEAVVREIRRKYRYVLVDLPRTLTPLTRSILAQSDRVVLVSELSLLGLRDSLRLRDYIKDELNRPEPIVVANREGLASRHELKKAQFEKHYGRPVDIHVPCMMEAFSATTAGEILVETTKNSTALDALHALAGKFVKGEKAVKQESPRSLFARIPKILRGRL